MKKLLFMFAMVFGITGLVSAQTGKTKTLKQQAQTKQAAREKQIALKIEAEKKATQTSDRIEKAPAVAPVADKKR